MKPTSNWNYYGALGNRVIWGNMDRLSLDYFNPSSEFGFLVVCLQKRHTPNEQYYIQSISFCYMFSEIKWKIYT